MAVPKKKTSKIKKAKRRYQWILTAYKTAKKFRSLSFQIWKQKQSTHCLFFSFIFYSSMNINEFILIK